MKLRFEKIITILLAIFSLLAASCTDKKKEVKEEPKIEISDTLIKHITIGIARTTQVRNELKLTGKVVADQSKQLQVYPLAGGTVKTLTAELGDYVEKDQVLAVIKSGEAADIEKQSIETRSNYEVAKKSAQAAEDMYNSKLMSEREYLQAKQELKKAEAEMNKVQELYKIYNLGDQSEYIIKAPISGFIIDKKINKDMQLRPDNGESIFTISQLNDVWIVANVYETDIDKVKEKDTVFVTTIAYPDRVYKATIDKVYSVLDPETRVMRVRAKLDNPDYLLKPEMYANVVVNYAEPKQMVTVSSNALIFDNSNNYLLIYKGGNNFQVRKVEVYKTIGKKSYIMSGVSDNEKVVTQNQLLIYNALTNN